tara:strand:- start:179 stop:571 length:393 start_codon:yes stop_codon:yes gene_type:complete
MVAGTHGSTFGGNPLATAVGNAVLDVITAPGFLRGAMETAAYLRAGLASLITRFPDVLAEQTGMGYMIGLKCVVSNADLLQALKERHLLAVKAGSNSIRLLPPLNMTRDEIDEALTCLNGACDALSNKST